MFISRTGASCSNDANNSNRNADGHDTCNGIDPTAASMILSKLVRTEKQPQQQRTQAVTLQKSQPLPCASAGVASPRQSSWQAGVLLEVQGLGFRVHDCGSRISCQRMHLRTKHNCMKLDGTEHSMSLSCTAWQSVGIEA